MPELALSGGLQNQGTARHSLFDFTKSMFSMGRRRRNIEAVIAGAKFWRETPDHSVETAKVISISKDGMGIPHVRYELEIRKQTAFTKMNAGYRSLALETFAKTYQAAV